MRTWLAGMLVIGSFACPETDDADCDAHPARSVCIDACIREIDQSDCVPIVNVCRAEPERDRCDLLLGRCTDEPAAQGCASMGTDAGTD